MHCRKYSQQLTTTDHTVANCVTQSKARLWGTDQEPEFPKKPANRDKRTGKREETQENPAERQRRSRRERKRDIEKRKREHHEQSILTPRHHPVAGGWV
jgi:hypothetical protein